MAKVSHSRWEGIRGIQWKDSTFLADQAHSHAIDNLLPMGIILKRLRKSRDERALIPPEPSHIPISWRDDHTAQDAPLQRFSLRIFHDSSHERPNTTTPDACEQGLRPMPPEQVESESVLALRNEVALTI
jgi:hypothetical protein